MLGSYLDCAAAEIINHCKLLLRREIRVHGSVLAPIIGVLAAPSAATLSWEEMFARVRGEMEIRELRKES